MNSGTLIVGAILVLLCVGPYIYILLSAKNNALKISEAFDHQAEQHGLKITVRNLWKNKMIGLDQDKKELLYIRMNGNEVLTDVVNLQHYRSCNSHEAYRHIKESAETVVTQITLDFVAASSKTPNRSLVIFDMKTDKALETEHVLMKKWVSLLGKHLLTKNEPKPQASELLTTHI